MKAFSPVKLSTQFWGLLILGLHIIGVIGTTVPVTHSITTSLTPVNLLISAALLIHFHTTKEKLPIFTMVVFLGGFFIEVAGVKSGILFGEYWYGDTLGLKLMEVPLVMGVNWFLLTYIFGNLASGIKIHWTLQSLLGALGMVGLDILIEPVAMKLDYWQWQNDVVPLQNYLMWFLCALCFQMIYHKKIGGEKNALAIYLIVSQITYFLGVYLFS